MAEQTAMAVCQGCIDLHAHSTASDGSFTPSELVKLASFVGLSALALTDHDTVSGCQEAMDTARSIDFNLVPGVEISCDYDKFSLHILGYYIDYEHPPLIETLTQLKKFRSDRNLLLIDKLRELGIDIDYAEVKLLAGEDVVGRPHFAMALVQKGIVSTTQEAFDKYLAKGKPAYIDKKRLTAEEGVKLIRDAKGVPVLAHPGEYKFLQPKELRKFLEDLIPHGLAGMEVWYSTHSEQLSAEYLKLTEELGLIATGGSDFHGRSKPNIGLGTGIDNNLDLSSLVLDNLKQRRKEIHGA